MENFKSRSFMIRPHRPAPMIISSMPIIQSKPVIKNPALGKAVSFSTDPEKDGKIERNRQERRGKREGAPSRSLPGS
jgi:hypothetical protein